MKDAAQKYMEQGMSAEEAYRRAYAEHAEIKLADAENLTPQERYRLEERQRRLQGEEAPTAPTPESGLVSPESVLDTSGNRPSNIEAEGPNSNHRQSDESDTITNFRDMMTPEEAAAYDRYWSQGTGTVRGVKENGEWVKKIMDGDAENTRQRMYTNPGTRSITDVKLGSNGEMYYRETIFDEYGRKIGHNDYTNHGRPDHANPHHHTNPVGDPSQHSSPVPGVHPQTPKKGDQL